MLQVSIYYEVLNWLPVEVYIIVVGVVMLYIYILVRIESLTSNMLFYSCVWTYKETCTGHLLVINLMGLWLVQINEALPLPVVPTVLWMPVLHHGSEAHN